MKQIFIFIIFLFFGSHILHAQVSEDSLHHLALRGIDLATMLQYKEAFESFEKMVKLAPDDPRGYFLRSAVYFWMFSTDMHNEELGERFKDLSYEAVEVAEQRLDKDEKDINALFYLGGAYGSLGRYYGMKQSYLKAYWYGKKGVNILEEVIEKDSTYYDAYLGLGIYHYLADILPRFVKILSFLLGIEGDRDQGIRELNLAVEKGVYVKTEAMFFLGAIYTYREREYNKALNIWNRLLQKYPGNPGVLIHMGRCYENQGNCLKAVDIYKKILAKKEEAELIPISSIHYQLGNVQYKLNDFENAIESYKESLRMDTLFSENRRWTYPWSQLRLGESYEMIGDRATAYKHYQMIREDKSERAYKRAQQRINTPMQEIDKKILIGRNYIGCKRYQKALQHFQKELDALVEKSSEFDIQKKNEITYYMGETYYHLRNYYKAIEYLNQLLVVQNLEDRLKSWTYYHRANCYRALGDKKRALEDYERTGDIDDPIVADKIKEIITSLKNN
jgi:tetratricopeptide (TPR) repeat protein